MADWRLYRQCWGPHRADIPQPGTFVMHVLIAESPDGDMQFTQTHQWVPGPDGDSHFVPRSVLLARLC